MRTPGIVLALACTTVLLLPASAMAATNATDPVGDNCAGGYCGPDLTGAADQVAADGSVRLSITRASSVCDTESWDPTEVQPYFQVLSGSATAQTDTASYLGAVWAVSTTSEFQWTPQGGGADVPVASTVSAGSVEVVLPASLVSSLGGPPLKWFVNNSCKEYPYDPPTAYKDFAPDNGLYTLTGPPADVCPNLAGNQAAVPSGMVKDSAGSCVTPAADVCPNLAGPQAEVPAGHIKDAAGNCLRVVASPVRINGTAAADTLLGNDRANVIFGMGGNDRLFGRAGNDTLRGGSGNDMLFGDSDADVIFGDAGADTARGGAGADRIKGGPGKDRLFGDAGNDTIDGRDRKGGDVVNGGAGKDLCFYNRGDVVIGCERKQLRS